MMQDLSTDTTDVLKEIDRRFYDIPFENSQHQNKHSVIASMQTPARAYRTIGLRMYAKIGAVNELKFSRLESQVDIDEWNSVIDDPLANEFKKRRAKISIDRNLSMLDYTNKLLNDAIIELNFFYAQLKEFPEYTREQFESEEREHFLGRFALAIQTNGNGDKQSLAWMNNNDIFQKNLAEAKKAIAGIPVSVDQNVEPYIEYSTSELYGVEQSVEVNKIT